jgi:subtilisin
VSTSTSLAPSSQTTIARGRGYFRRARRYIGGLIVLIAIPCGAVLAQTVGPPSVIPDAITVDVPTTITVTAAISGNVIPQSVEVQRLDSLGNPIAIIGKLADDGVSPDLVAGDGVYTGTVSISDSTIGKVALRVSVGFAGSLRRTVSVPVSIDVVPTGFPTTYVPNPNAPTDIDPNTGATIITNEVLVCFAPLTSVSTILATAKLINGTVSGRIYGGLPTGDSCYQISLSVSSTTAVSNAVQSLKIQPNVTVAEPDVVTQLDAFTCPVPQPTGNTKSYNNVQLDAAQKISTGQGVKVAVLDTGVDIYNSDLSPHIAEVIDGADDFGHGTNVSGIVAAMAPKASILSIKVCGSTLKGYGCPEERQLIGINKAMAAMAAMGPVVVPIVNGCPVTPKGPGGVINMSLGDRNPLPSVAKLITCAISQNIVVVTSAGNEADPALQTALHYPASDAGVINVGNVDENDVRNVCSVHGSWVTMSAPGVNIQSAGCFNWSGPVTHTCGPNPNNMTHHTTSTLTGTSQASPFVAGTAALVKAAYPTLDAKQVRDQILGGAMPIVDAQSNNEDMGVGRLDALAALGAIRLTHIGNTPQVDFWVSTDVPPLVTFSLSNKHTSCEVQSSLPCAVDFPTALFKKGTFNLTIHDTDPMADIGLQLLSTNPGLIFTGVISGNGTKVNDTNATAFLIGNAINGALSFVKFSLERK